MAEVCNDVSRFGGRWMIQDNDHMSEIVPTNPERAERSGKQSEQSQPRSRQQGADNGTGRQAQ